MQIPSFFGRTSLVAIALLVSSTVLAAQASSDASVDCSDPNNYALCQQRQPATQGGGSGGGYGGYPTMAMPQRTTSQGQNGRDVYVDTGGFPVDRPAADRANANFPLILPPDPITDFQRLARQATGETLSIYGRELFRTPPSTFAPADQIPVMPDYVLGPGDEVVLRIWGHDNFNGRLVVDRNGAIYIPQVGAIHVAGQRFGDLQPQIQRELNRTYRNYQMSLNLGQLRSIQVFVLGEARRPGTYTVSSLSTAFNAVLASGGPTVQGSMRRIEVRRGGATLTTLDLYDFVSRGDRSKDVSLQTGDVLFVPVIGPQVALSGSVRHPAIFELLPGETLANALTLAGGLSSTASEARVSIDRIEGHRERQALSIALDAAGLATVLSDGDVLHAGSVLGGYTKSVTIRGNLANAGRFPWHEGMKLSEIIPDRPSLLTNDYWRERNRLGLPTPLFEPLPSREFERYDLRDRSIGARSNQLYQQYRYGGSNGATSRANGTQRDPLSSNDLPYPGDPQYLNDTYASDPTQTQADSIALARRAEELNAGNNGYLQNDPQGRDSSLQGSNEQLSRSSLAEQQQSATDRLRPNNARRTDITIPAPEIDWSYAVIERLDPQTLRNTLVPFHLGKLVNDHDSAEDKPLQAGDVVTILSQADIHGNQDDQTKYIRLEGELISSGVYSVAPNETLADVVARAGGLTSKAYLFGASFTRESARVLQQQRLDEYISSLSIQIERDSSIRSLSSGAPANGLTEERALLDQMRKMRATGRIVLEFKPDSAGMGSLPRLPLENGDTFRVPSRPAVVSVVGSVYGQNVFLYNDGRRVRDYLALAGKPNRVADKNHAFIIRADGSIYSKDTVRGGLWGDNFNAAMMHPGDTVVVPEKPLRPSALRQVIDYSQVFSQFAVGAASLSVITR